MLIFGVLSIIAISQIYRYRYVSSSVQRYQTRVVVFGFTVGLVLGIGLYVPELIVPVLNQPGSFYQAINSASWYVFILLFALSFALVLLRYRLYDIDVLINRTLVYGTLTAILALVYVGCIILMQYFLRGIINPNNNVAIVVSTLAIAALFQPLRKRIQAIIDRRFYRRKYDAARTLAAFSATLRNELDLNQLSEHLVAVVQETMQPTHVSLRLRKTQYERKSQATAPSRGEFGTAKIRREIP